MSERSYKVGYNAGYNDAFNGNETSNPHRGNSQQAEDWFRGHCEGLSVGEAELLRRREELKGDTY